MLQLREDESVLCSANQARYHEKKLATIFFCFCFSGFFFVVCFCFCFCRDGVAEEEKWVSGISEGIRHASNKDDFYIGTLQSGSQLSLKA